MLTIAPRDIAAIVNAQPMPAILTVGYGGLRDVAHLKAIVDALGATVVDVRKVPAGARVNRLWQQGAIRAAIGEERYLWKGNVLGGLSHVGANVKPEGLEWLRAEYTQRRLLLLCACEAPHLCHRARHILGGFMDIMYAGGDEAPAFGHIYEDSVCDGWDMLRMADDGDDECSVWAA